MRKNGANELESSPLNPAWLEIKLRGGFSGPGQGIEALRTWIGQSRLHGCSDSEWEEWVALPSGLWAFGAPGLPMDLFDKPAEYARLRTH